ncbi:transferase [Streptomyces sp. NL15-2K]|uniref:transferase n=1 Tax=Streptomyces sp. NL15-2K TaxID=376149 RepID=UPI000F55F727|nr:MULTISPECIES: transferase [Actinomycetes]WKX14546.1 hypothetical protein Q4V64_46415 [Kutzneria buriramensis]GCB44321.1 hypothetical protein SNL152K_1610 [Streptomyces sp. NL15-2K]
MSAEHGAHPRVGCAVDADGRITFDLPTPPEERHEGQQLLLRLRPKKGQPEKALHVLDLEPAADGRLYTVLGPHAVLAEGRWDVYLIQDAGSGRQRLRPGLRDLRVLVDGHLRDWQSPLAIRIPYATKDGYLAVRAWLRTAHAEVSRIDITKRSTTVRARLHGAALQAGAAVRLRLRSGTVRTVEPRAEDDGRSFSFTIDHEDLAAGTAAGSGVWDVFVRPAAEAPLIRVARLLDDVADRKEVFVYPKVTVGGAVLRPYYTVDNDLSVEVMRAGSELWTPALTA